MPLDIPALLDWANKVNTPEVQAMLQQYAITHKLTAEEINQLRDRINWILQNFPAEFDPATADLADFLNESEDPYVRESELPMLYITERMNSNNTRNVWWGKRPVSVLTTSDAPQNINFGNNFSAITSINGNQSVFYNLGNKSFYIKKLVHSITHGADGVLKLGIITFKKVNNLGFSTVPDNIARYEFVLGNIEFQRTYNFVLDSLNIEIPIQHQFVCFFYIENAVSTAQVFNSLIHFNLSE